MKTIKQWYDELPNGYRELALRNLNSIRMPFASHVGRMSTAILNGFLWRESPEGEKFWTAVCLHYSSGRTLPPLPTSSTPNPTIAEEEVDPNLI